MGVDGVVCILPWKGGGWKLADETQVDLCPAQSWQPYAVRLASWLVRRTQTRQSSFGFECSNSPREVSGFAVVRLARLAVGNMC